MKGIQTTQVGNPDNADIPYITNKRKIDFPQKLAAKDPDQWSIE